MVDIDTAALQQNFAHVASHGGDEVALYFYSHLFVHYPETRDMFAPSMTRQRIRLIEALGRVVSHVDQIDELVPFLQDLGRDHRKFGALAGHYPAVGASLIATLQHFSEDEWTARLHGDWAAAYGIVAETMIGAANDASRTLPPWWEGRVLAVRRPTFDLAVLRVRIDGSPLPYVPGQSLSLEAMDLRPRDWRFYSPANAPRTDHTVDLHVRLIAGGRVSTALVRSAEPGTRLRFGPPIGGLTLDPASRAPLLMIAGGTGLAPMLALLESLANEDVRRPTHLFFGVRTARELYASQELEMLAARHDWLTVTTAVSDDTTYDGVQGLIGEVAVGTASWVEHDVYVCGSPAMVEFTVKELVTHGVAHERIRFDEFGEN